MSSKKKSKSSFNQTSTSAPPAWTQGGLTQAGSMVQNALGQIPQQHYAGQQVSYLNPTDLANIQQAWGNTADLAGEYTGYLQGMLPQLTASPQFSTGLPTGDFDMGNRFEGLDATIQAATHPVMQQLMEQILPGIKSSALDAGAYSGDRAMIVAPQAAIADATDAMGRTAAQLAYQDYQDFENRRLSAWQGDRATQLGAYNADTQRQLGLADNNQSMLSTLPAYIQSMLKTSSSQGDLLNMAAQLGVTNQQQQINDAIARDKYASYSPFMGLDTATQLLTALSGNWGTQTASGKSKTTESSGGLGSAIQGALGLGTALMGFPGVGAALGLGGAAGAAAGGATGLSSFLGPNGAGSLFQPANVFSSLGPLLQGG